MQTTFTMICECFRCGGFKLAFATFGCVNDGRCLRCNGGLRTVVTKPIARLGEYHPDPAKRRAEAIATLATCLALVGAPHVKDAKGRRVSAWGFTYWARGDNERVLAAALTIAPEDVRVRAWRAFVAKVRATMPEKGDKPMGFIKRLLVEYAGLPAEAMGAWLGETASEDAKAA